MAHKVLKPYLKKGGYAIISSSVKGIRASIWFENRFFGIEPLGEGFYFISETDMELIRQQESNIDYIDMSQNKLKKEQSEKVLKHSSLSAILSSTNVKVFVAYTLPVAQNYDVEYLIDDCEFVTGDAFENSLVASTIEIC
jgi:hypothetical protein